MYKGEMILDDVLKELRKRNARRIGIQIPDGLKYKCHEIVDFFEGKGYEVILSGSACYGACDIDLDLLKEVDVLIHFAHTPIFEFKNVIYVPYHIDYDFRYLERVRIDESRIALISTAQYAWKLPDVKVFLEGMGYEVELKKGSGRVKMPGQVLGCNYTALRDSRAEAVLFIGDGLFHPTGAKIYTNKKVYRFSPLEKEFEEVKVEEFIKKRVLIVSKAEDSERGAILISRKIGQRRISLAFDLKSKADKAGKKVDLIYMDEIVPRSLDNFPYDYYVNTACPRISYDDVDLFKVPILTPYEFEILLDIRDWDDYRMDEIL